LVLAEVRNPGLQSFLEGQARELAADGKAPFRFVDDAQKLPSNGNEKLPVITIHDNVLAIGSQDSVVEFTSDNRRPFADAYFHTVISRSYASGVGWLFCANLEHIVRHSVLRRSSDPDKNPTGMQDVRYLIYERKDTGGSVENRVALQFRGNRRGFASWLGAPGPMGALDFVSPNALVAAAFVVRNPQAMLSELFSYAKDQNSNFVEGLSDFEQRSGVNVLRDVAGPLGTDAAFAIDGPIFPVPNWEFAMEVYNPDRLEWTLEKLIDDFNRQSPDARLTLTKEQAAGRTYYAVSGTNPNVEAHYAFADSYFVAGATQGIVMRAIQNRENGYTLARSERFRALLPRDSYPSFSGLIYHNIGPLIGPIAQQLKSLGGITPAQRASIEALQSNSGPGLSFAYGEPDRIVISGAGAWFGLSLDSLAVPHIIADAVHAGGRFQSRP
jgi:hypothetical protein